VPTGSREVKLIVESDNRVKTARLIIPRSLLSADRKTSSAGFHLPTIMAGLALTAAVVSGGLWLVRRGPVRKPAALVLLVSLAVLGSSALYADLPASGRKPPKPRTVKLPGNFILPEKLNLEIVDKGDAVKLIINDSMDANEKLPPKE
jgi:hypothetical protein